MLASLRGRIEADLVVVPAMGSTSGSEYLAIATAMLAAAAVIAQTEDAFTVQVGLGTTMTAQDILNGIMRVTVALAVMQPDVFVEQSFEQAVLG